MSKLPSGLGSITKTLDGRFWVRGPRELGRPSWGVYETEEEADRARLVRLNVKEEEGLKRETTQTFLKFGASTLDDREKEGVRGVKNERYSFHAHLATAHFAGTPIDRITTPDVARWLRDMGQKKARKGTGAKGKSVSTNEPLSRATILRAFTLLSSIFDAAGPNGLQLIESNPCAGLEVKKRPGKRATKDVEVFLTLEEQEAIRTCELIPDRERFFILFAFGCGVRRGEQTNLEIRDVCVDGENPHVVVRFGADGLPPKNGEVEAIPLFGFALEAARWQLKNLESQPNPLGLLWPTVNGHRIKGRPLRGHFRPVEKGGTHVLLSSGATKRVAAGKGTHVYVDRFRELLGFAGISRRVRWHDLRHTCASALLQGQWGDAWTLPEVQAQLRHSSVTVTERYAHLGETALKRAAKKVTVGDGWVSGAGTNGGAGSGVAAIRNTLAGLEEASPAGFGPATPALGRGSILEMLRALATEKDANNPAITHLAGALASLLGENAKHH